MDRCGEGQREVREKAKGGTLSQVLDKSRGRSALHQTLTDCCRGVMMNGCFTERRAETFVFARSVSLWYSMRAAVCEGPADLGTVIM